MRYLLIMLMSLMLAAPAYAAGTADAPATTTVPKAKGVTKVAPVDTVAKALASANKTPVSVTGTIVEPVQGKKNRYVVDDGTGRMTVVIGTKTLKGMELTPDMKVRLMGKIKVKEGKAPVMGVRALHLVK